MMGPGCWWGQGGFFGTPGGMLLGVVFWLLVLYCIVGFIAGLARRGRGTAGKEEMPLDILRKRYARGEIDADEFAQKKRDLEPGISGVS